jgi:hypothetical protein
MYVPQPVSWVSLLHQEVIRGARPQPLRPEKMDLRNPIIELLFFLVRKMAKTVPLAGDLGVKGPDVVVDYSRRLVEDFLVEEGAVEERF